MEIYAHIDFHSKEEENRNEPTKCTSAKYYYYIEKMCVYSRGVTVFHIRVIRSIGRW